MLKYASGLAACLSLSFILGANAAIAEGALAIGSTGRIAADGIAYGGSYNYPTRQEAINRALAECRAWKASKAAANCELVATFKGECYAFANDPKGGTPGTGWAIAADGETASQRALAACRSVAGRDRRSFCVVGQSSCDAKN